MAEKESDGESCGDNEKPLHQNFASRLSTDVAVSQVVGLMEDLINGESDEISPRTQSKLKQICDILRQASGPAASASDAPLSSDAVNTMAAHDPNVMHQQEEAAARKASAPIRRYSQSVWSTVTTATGMPAVEEQSNLRPSFRKKTALVSSNSVSFGAQTHRRTQFLSSFRRRLSTGYFRQADVPAPMGFGRYRSGDDDDDDDSAPNGVATSSSASCISCSNGLLSVSAPDKDKSSMDDNEIGMRGKAASLPSDSGPAADFGLAAAKFSDTVGGKKESIDEEVLASAHAQAPRPPVFVGFPKEYLPAVLAIDMAYNGVGLVPAGQLVDGMEGDEEMMEVQPLDADAVLSELEVPETTADVPLLEEINEWNFPIFELACETGGHVLSMLACHLFERDNLFADLQIPHDKFMAYFHRLECGYRDNPYHNRIHAADVLQSMAYLLNSNILGFSASVVEESNKKTVVGHEMRDISCSDLLSALKEGTLPTGSCGTMREGLSSLELAACYIAAAQHDYDHPARTNAFLVSTQSDLSILYNDRAVLEQHHAASSWKLLLDHPEYNFLECMPASDVRVLRFLALEMILATDLAKHFDMIRTFNAKVSNGKIFMQTREDRLSVMQMCIKLADINGPAKCGPLHRKWAYLICEEFYDQGEEEARLDMPISLYMDKNNPLLPKLQISFISNLLRPLLSAYASAGFMPGPYELSESAEERLADGSTCFTTLGQLHDNVNSMIVENARVNEDFWQKVLKAETEKKKKEEEESGASTGPSSVE